MSIKITTFLILCGALLCLGADLNVTIEGIKNREGLIQITLFDQANGFPSQYKRGKIYRTIENSSTNITVSFDSLQSGTYAVAVIHDVNSNKKLDTGLFGIPKEGYGVSRNIHPKTRAPKFSECSFVLNTADTSIAVQIKYP